MSPARGRLGRCISPSPAAPPATQSRNSPLTVDRSRRPCRSRTSPRRLRGSSTPLPHRPARAGCGMTPPPGTRSCSRPGSGSSAVSTSGSAAPSSGTPRSRRRRRLRVHPLTPGTPRHRFAFRVTPRSSMCRSAPTIRQPSSPGSAPRLPIRPSLDASVCCSPPSRREHSLPQRCVTPDSRGAAMFTSVCWPMRWANAQPQGSVPRRWMLPCVNSDANSTRPISTPIHRRSCCGRLPGPASRRSPRGHGSWSASIIPQFLRCSSTRSSLGC